MPPTDTAIKSSSEKPSEPPAPARDRRAPAAVTEAKPAGGRSRLGEDDYVPADFTEAIYDAITKAFANKNPTQMFCLCWPGTILDSQHLGWEESEEVGGNMPERVLIRSSLLLDQYVPPSPITQPDGTRVSNRYRQAIGQLGPIPNEHLHRLQAIIRDRLDTEITVTVDGEEKQMSLVEWFDMLYMRWVRAKQDWGQMQTSRIKFFEDRYPEDRERAWNAYLGWYQENADGYIQQINAKHDQLLAEFPLTSWNDAIAILDTADDGLLNYAKRLASNMTLPIPRQEGVDYVPTRGVPYRWAKELTPTTKYIDLLADPEAQNMALQTAIRQVEQEIATWMAILPQLDDAELKQRADTMHQAGRAYGEAQSALIEQYTENTVEAVKIFADVMESRQQGGISDITDSGEQQEVVDGVNDLRETTGGYNGQKVDWKQVKEIAEKVGKGQKDLIGKQQALIDAGRDLAGAADDFLREKSNRLEFPWLPGYVSQLQAKLDRLHEAQAQHESASNVYYKYLKSRGNDEQGKNPNETTKFGDDANPSNLNFPEDARWTTVTMAINQSQMKKSRKLATYFKETQWSVDLFLGSAGGSYQESGTEFADKFMKADSEIQIGFLAAKVVIERPWMLPEVFANTANYFRTMDKPLSPQTQTTHGDLLGPGGESKLMALLNNHSFPAYPVAVLLAKDVTVRVNVQREKTEQLRETASSVKSQGGGFLCFSVSAAESSQSENESLNSFCMAGQMVARAPSPQIIGYWVQFLPPDNSEPLSEDMAEDIARTLGVLENLREVFSAARAAPEEPPTPPSAKPAAGRRSR